MHQRITTNLWFDNEAEEAANFYCSIFPNSKIVSTADYTEDAPGETGTVMVVEWELDGQRFVGINGGAEPGFKFSEAISLQINCEDQAEIDYYWEKLTADGGEEGPCGWCKDKYGLSWQVTPEGMDSVFSDPTKDANAAMKAMLGMRKIDVARLEAAADGRVPA